MIVFQDELIYWPTARSTLYPAFNYETHDIAGSDIRYALYTSGNLKESHDGIVLYLHGRGENSTAIHYFTSTYDDEWIIYALEYPGFNGLPGRPSEAAIAAAIADAYALIRTRMKPGQKLVIHGNSLGAGPALQAAQYPHDLLVLTAPVGNMTDLATHYAPMYPSFLVRSNWDNWQRARTAYKAPRYVHHSRDDMIVPYSQGQKLAEILGAEMRPSEYGGHLIGRKAGLTVSYHFGGSWAQKWWPEKAWRARKNSNLRPPASLIY